MRLASAGGTNGRRAHAAGSVLTLSGTRAAQRLRPSYRSPSWIPPWMRQHHDQLRWAAELLPPISKPDWEDFPAATLEVFEIGLKQFEVFGGRPIARQGVMHGAPEQRGDLVVIALGRRGRTRHGVLEDFLPVRDDRLLGG